MKRIVCLLMVVLLVALAACGTAQEASVPQSEASAPQVSSAGQPAPQPQRPKNNGASEDREYMHKRQEDHHYRVGEGFVSSSLGLKHGRMTFILPDEGLAPADLLQAPQVLAQAMATEEGEMAEVIFQVPKFSFRTSLAPKEQLRGAGLTLPFDDEHAAFPGFVSKEELERYGNLYVDSIFQQTYIRVDEKGAEAAAVTGVPMAPATAIEEEPKIVELRLTRPFLFVLERTATDSEGKHINVPLFVGVVNDPGMMAE